MKPIREVLQTTRRSCVTACLLMMSDIEVTEELYTNIHDLYTRSANLKACASLLSVQTATVDIAAGNWIETGNIYLVFAVKAGEFHALVVDCRNFTPVVHDPARGYDDNVPFVWEAEPDALVQTQSLNKSLYIPVLRFTDRLWVGH